MCRDTGGDLKLALITLAAAAVATAAVATAAVEVAQSLNSFYFPLQGFGPHYRLLESNNFLCYVL